MVTAIARPVYRVIAPVGRAITAGWGAGWLEATGHLGLWSWVDTLIDRHRGSPSRRTVMDDGTVHVTLGRPPPWWLRWGPLRHDVSNELSDAQLAVRRKVLGVRSRSPVWWRQHTEEWVCPDCHAAGRCAHDGCVEEALRCNNLPVDTDSVDASVLDRFSPTQCGYCGDTLHVEPPPPGSELSMRLCLMPEILGHALWEDDGYAHSPIGTGALALPSDLAASIDAWAEDYENWFETSKPYLPDAEAAPRPKPQDDEWLAAIVSTGRHLWHRLADELGSGFEVRYYNELTMCFEERPRRPLP